MTVLASDVACIICTISLPYCGNARRHAPGQNTSRNTWKFDSPIARAASISPAGVARIAPANISVV